MYSIQINNMKFYAYNGCLQEERVLGQHLEIDLIMFLKPEFIELDDNLNNSINYVDAYQITETIVKETQANLIETLAHKIAKQIRDTYPNKLERVNVVVRKYHVPINGIFDNIEIKVSLKNET